MITSQRRYPFLIWLAVFSLAPALFLTLWSQRSRRLFNLREPQLDMFLFHDTKAVYVNVFLITAGFILFAWPQLFGWPAKTLNANWEKYRAPAIKYFPVFFFILAAALALPVYQNTALTLDEYAAFFQAEAFSHGSLGGKMPIGLIPWAVPRWLGSYFFTVSPEGLITETYLPGYALLLAPFVKLNLGWLFNPTLGALILATLVSLARRLFDDETALWVAVLAISSPVFWVNSVSFYSLNCRLLFNLLFLYFLWPSTAMTGRRALLAGLAGGMAAFTHNPYPHVVFALPWLLYFFYRKESRRFIWALCLGYLPFVLLTCSWGLLLYRSQTVSTGPTGGGFTYAWDMASALVPPPWSERTFVMWSTSLCKLLLWSTPGIWFFFLSTKSIKSPFLRLSLISFVLTFFAYGLAKNRVAQGFGWGHRYSYAAMGAVWLAAAYWLARREQRSAFRIPAMGMALGGLLVMTPLQLIQTHRFIASQNKKLPCLAKDVRQVCLVVAKSDYYLGDRLQNDPFLKRPRLLFHSAGKESDDKMMQEFFPNYELKKRDDRHAIWLPKEKP